jgi:hypothetical protein
MGRTWAAILTSFAEWLFPCLFITVSLYYPELLYGISEQDLASKEMDGGAHREANPSHSS